MRCAIVLVVLGCTVAFVAGSALGASTIWPPAPSGTTAPDPFDPALPPILGPGIGAHVSHNWVGYEQGAEMRPGPPFTAITARWTVPRARPHHPNQAEAAADWIGIGGGCVDPGCAQTDPTLIQTGTIDLVARAGTVTYSAWYELIPAPPQPISNMAVAPGDRMGAALSQQAGRPDRWQITIRDLTRGEVVSMTVPYRSNRASAEWIEETPMKVGADSGLVPLPTLSQAVFSDATVNGRPARLAVPQRTTLRTAAGRIGSPSLPAAGGTAFAVCAWSASCT